MTASRSPSAWVVCDCGAVVANNAQHAAWHADLEQRLTDLAQVVPISESAPADDDEGAV